MFRLMAAAGLVVMLAGCVAAPGYGYYDQGYAYGSGYGPDYAPAYGYGTVNIWGGGGRGGYERRGWGDHGHYGGVYWQHGGGRGNGGGHGGGHGH
ncbi:hypothetical protein N0A02_19225 [Paraburkholderia acidicola]|uniref:Lipoprotein n=1 Tax=Paraburkholderia acidicola TaxID=1912599 RepID=A0ABV1LRH6_9BURK